MLLLLLGCPSKDRPDDSDTLDPWDLPATSIGDAMLLGAWSRGEELLIVGGDLAAGGHGDLVHVEGGELCIEHGLAEAPLWWIHGDGQDFWAVGAQGIVLREVGGERTRMDIETDMTLFGVYDRGDGGAWVVGGDTDAGTGALWSTDGQDWTLVTETEGVLFKVWDGYVVGDGQAFQVTSSGLVQMTTDHRLVTVRGDGDTVTAVGGSGNAVVTQWDGSAWTELDPSRLNGALNGVWTGPAETLWVAGNAGVMGRRADDGSWEVPDFPLTSDAFHAVWKHGEEVWWIGGNFYSTPYHGTLGRYSEDPSDLTDVGDCD
jgi:hypothetical protein